MNHLWLFDIDGTLVNIPQVHLATYKKMYQDFVHTSVSDDILLPTFGMTEHDMHPVVFKSCGIKKDEKLIRKMIAAHPRYFREELARHDVKPLPGVNAFVQKLKKLKQPYGIVTGNLKENAELILKKAKLEFDAIATDDGTKARWQIVKAAIDTFGKKGHAWKSVVVIGDTITDIEAARHCAKQTGEKIISVAVATGTCTIEQLKDADIVLERMDCKKIFTLVESV